MKWLLALDHPAIDAQKKNFSSSFINLGLQQAIAYKQISNACYKPNLWLNKAIFVGKDAKNTD